MYTLLDTMSSLLPFNIDRQFIMCRAGECEVYYPVKLLVGDNNEVQLEYMNEMKDLYQHTIDEVQNNISKEK